MTDTTPLTEVGLADAIMDAWTKGGWQEVWPGSDTIAAQIWPRIAKRISSPSIDTTGCDGVVEAVKRLTISRHVGKEDVVLLDMGELGGYAWTAQGSPTIAYSLLHAFAEQIEQALTQPAQGWRTDMGNVPKGPGTRYVLLSRLGCAPYVGSYISDRHSEEPQPWFTAKGRTEAYQRSYPPTHWMPIPPTPPQEQ